MPELPAEVKELAARVRNWGRWGADDEVGALNFLGAANVLEAVKLIRSGRVFTLQAPMAEPTAAPPALPTMINGGGRR